MTKRQLKKIIKDYADNIKWVDADLWAWIRPEGLRPLTDAAGRYFDNGPVSADLAYDGSVLLDITAICDYWDIDPERIAPKKSH